jgi:hypothetical protein
MMFQLTAPQRARRIERGLKRFHNMLKLIELGAPRDLIEHAERLLARSLNELDMTEPQLARLYPRFRFVQMSREAAAKQRTQARARVDVTDN